jgi:hypothetical protein
MRKIAPLAFAPKAKDESNKLRRSNSLYEAIVAYLDAIDGGQLGIDELVDASILAAAKAKDLPEVKDDHRIAAVNKIADDVRAGNCRTLRLQVVSHFKTINRRFQGVHGLNSLLHIASREGFLPMLRIIFDDKTRIPADREVRTTPCAMRPRRIRARAAVCARAGSAWTLGGFLVLSSTPRSQSET